MSAGNRKYPQRPPVYKEVKKYNAAAVYLGCLVIVVLVGLLIGAGIAKASAAPSTIAVGKCADRGTITGFGYVDAGEFTLPDEGMEFEELRCNKAGNKVWITKADTYLESYDLEAWARSGWKHTGILCFSGERLTYLSSMDEISGVNVSERGIENYERWAKGYAARNHCERVR